MNLLVDSHCHLDFPELRDDIAAILCRMQTAGVGWALIAGVRLEQFPDILALAETHPPFFAAVGVHPEVRDGEGRAPEVEILCRLAAHPKVLAIGETGLDYYRLETSAIDQASIKACQQARLRVHIQAALAVQKPLIIHCRNAAEDTLRILEEEGTGQVGGIFHCFTEDLKTAQAALDLGFYISFSGILTFKNAQALKEIARILPADRILIETDAPYLAPTPHRGKTNEPAYVRLVGEELARLRACTLAEIAETTRQNFFRLFPSAAHYAHA